MLGRQRPMRPPTHILDLQVVSWTHTEGSFHRSDPGVGCRVEVLEHVGGLVGVIGCVHWLVHDAKYTGGSIIRVTVNTVRHPFEKYNSSLVIFWCVEPWRVDTLFYCQHIAHILAVGQLT